MATTTTYRSAVPSARDGFGQVLRAEWTKFRSVRSTAWCLILALVLTIGLSILGAAAVGTNVNESPPTDKISFVHRPMSGDGTITAHVRTQRNSQEWARAGVIVKQNTTSGSPYAAMMVTPDHGIRWQPNFQGEIVGSGDGAPRWLRLNRSGTTLTGYESADGRTWKRVGGVTLNGLPQTAEVGLFVTSPDEPVIERFSGGNSVTQSTPTTGVAVFDNVRIERAVPGPETRWSHTNVNPAGASAESSTQRPATGSFSQAGDTFTVTGSGDVGAAHGDDDIVQSSFAGLLIGLMAIVALGVLFATSEYKTGVIRTTFTASPRRGRVLAAKAIVLGSVTFAVGLVAGVGAFLAAQPGLRASGYEPPGYPLLSLSDGPVLRAVIGAAGFLAVLALFSLGVGAILRRTAGAITLIIVLVFVPQIVAPLLTSLTAAQWVQRLTPNAGLAIIQSVKRYDTALTPWAGFGVLCAYAALALGFAFWRLRRRDA
jgi:ABC-type transport system involved in multi-copper enzyme maturation permease subunit